MAVLHRQRGLIRDRKGKTLPWMRNGINPHLGSEDFGSRDTMQYESVYRAISRKYHWDDRNQENRVAEYEFTSDTPRSRCIPMIVRSATPLRNVMML